MRKARSIIISILLVLVTAAAGFFTFASFKLTGTKKYSSVFSTIDVGAEFTGAYRIDYSPVLEEDGIVSEKDLEKSIEIVKNRLDLEEFGSARVYKKGNGFTIEYPRSENVGNAYSYFGSKGVISLYVGSSASGTNYFDYNVSEYSSSPFIKGVSVSEAYSQDGIIYSASGYSVVLEFTKSGREMFKKATAAAAAESSNKYVSIYLDDEIQLTSAQVDSEMDTATVQISGSFTKAQAEIIASVIENGVMPVQFFNGKVVGIEEVDGQQYLMSSIYSEKVQKTLKIAFAVVFGVFLIAMGIFYKGFGLVADFTAIFSIILFVLVYSIIPGSIITMSSVLGMIASFFVYVAGCVIFFETIKKAFKNGSTLNASIGDSFKKSMWFVLDAVVLGIVAFFSSFFLATWTIRAFMATFAVGTIIFALTFSLFNRMLIAVFKPMVNQGRFYHLTREEAENE